VILDAQAISVSNFCSAVAGSAMLANAPGTVADIVNENYRALAFSIWSIGPMNGPVTGPLIGGFAAEYLGWRWTNWLVMILSGVGWIMISCCKETYGPSILKWRAAKLRKETGDDRWWCRYDQRLSRKSESTILGPKAYYPICSHPSPQNQSVEAFCSSTHRANSLVLECVHRSKSSTFTSPLPSHPVMLKFTQS
jgi:MFS family permease